LPAVTLAQDRPNLTRLLFEIAPASESAATAADVNTARDEQAADDAADATTIIDGEASIIDGEASVVSAAANDGESIARNTQASGNDTRASIAAYEEAVLELEQTSGPFATGLTERLLALGELYERSGDHEAAIATYEKAVHILRVNDGLFTLDQ